MGLPSITVVTPCLNSRATIEQTLESVTAQHYPQVEHVVVDGGSTDGTIELLEHAPGVRYTSEPDRGLTDAMNKGIGMARNDVIGWLNADDVYLPGALDAVGRAFATEPGREWVTGPCTIIDGEGHEIRSAVTRYKRFFLRRYSFGLLLTQNFVAAPATFVRRDAFGEIGPFDERFSYSMDYDYWLRLGRRGPPVVIDRPLSAFRMAEGSLSMTGFERQFAEHAQNAREHGDGHRVAATVNAVTSRAIVLIYSVMRRLRGS